MFITMIPADANTEILLGDKDCELHFRSILRLMHKGAWPMNREGCVGVAMRGAPRRRCPLPLAFTYRLSVMGRCQSAVHGFHAGLLDHQATNGSDTLFRMLEASAILKRGGRSERPVRMKM